MPLVLRIALAAALLCSSPAFAEITLLTSRPLAQGYRLFVGHCGRSGPITLFNWNSFPDQSHHRLGRVDPQYSASILQQPGTSNRAYRVTGNLVVANWIDADGFGTGPKWGSADLGVNDKESFNLSLAAGYRSVGFGVITGMTNAKPSQVDKQGASFEVTAYNALGGLLGTRTFELRRGKVDAVWVTVGSLTPIRRLSIREAGMAQTPASLKDQYFTNILGCVP